MSFFEGLRAFCSTLWAPIVAAFLFLPRLVHDLCVQPEENEQGRHMLTWEFGQAYWNLPYLLRTLAFKTRTADEQLRETMLRGTLRRTFKRWNLVNIGVGIVIGQSCRYLNSILMGQFPTFRPATLTRPTAEASTTIPAASGRPIPASGGSVRHAS